MPALRGACLVVVGLVAAQSFLGTNTVPSVGHERAIDFTPPQPGLIGRSFVATMGVFPGTCGSPVSVALAFVGSAEYWNDHRSHLPKRAGFKVTLPPGAKRVRVGIGLSLFAVQPVPDLPLKKNRRVSYSIDHRHDGSLVVRGAVQNWERTQDALLLDFDAEWMVHRSLGTCYLPLPELASDTQEVEVLPSYLTARARRRISRALTKALVNSGPKKGDLPALTFPDVTGEGVSGGIAQVVSGQGELVAESSRRPPDDYRNGLASWRCEPNDSLFGRSTGIGTRPIGSPVPDATLGKPVPAFSVRAYLRGSGTTSGCAATAVLAGASAATSREVALIVIAAVVSLGLVGILTTTLQGLGGAVALTVLFLLGDALYLAVSGDFAEPVSDYIDFSPLLVGSCLGLAVCLMAIRRLTEILRLHR